jgi:arylsulfatase A-like enzyme
MKNKLNRRQFMQLTAGGSLALLAGCAGGTKNAAMQTRPNILVITADDLRADAAGALGDRQVITPNIDSLVSRGTTFTNAYIMGGTSGAVCIASRAMLMTGRNLFSLEDGGSILPPQHTTMGETFRQSGYYTYHVGKWHHDRNSFNRSYSSADRIFCFEQQDWMKIGGHWNMPIHDYDPAGQYTFENRYVIAKDGVTKLPAVKRTTKQRHSSEVFADAAVEFLENYNRQQPFLMYVGFVAPHDPRQAPAEFEDMYSTDKIKLPPNFMPEHPFDNGDLRLRDEMLEAWPRTPKAIRGHLRDYYAAISHMDAQLGRILKALDKTGRADSTVVVFAGDNGLAVGQHGLMGKQSLYEHTIKVPLVLSGSGIPKNKRRRTFVYLSDLFPTLCELAAIEIPDSVQTISFAPAIRKPSIIPRDSLFFAYRDLQRAVRIDEHKLIEYYVKGKRTTQLFDLEKDPWEKTNLAGEPDHTQTLQQMRNELARWKRYLAD